MKPLRRLKWLLGFFSIASPFGFAEEISFNREIRPVLSHKCFACHGPDDNRLEAGLRLDVREIATRSLESGTIAIFPGEPDKSTLLARVTDPDEENRMPPALHSTRLTDNEIALLRDWIQQGAKYEVHWAYVPPQRPPAPQIPADMSSWPRNPLDNFVLDRMRQHELSPSTEADSTSLVRRLFLDLTGLPPTLDEVHAFNTSTHDDPYDALVDDLLSRPAFGEHWARQWLDLARYADSAGYADDPPRTIWAYRDWVIKALNANMPFDQFTVEQLAGDLLPNPTDDQRIATAFHRNTMTNNEGGTVDEEFRNVAIVDRVNTTLAVWMGTTMACAQCHNHKYDPISQEEYFQVFAIFNNTQDADRTDESPLLPIYPAGQKAQLQILQGQLADLRARVPVSLATLIDKAAADRTSEEQTELANVTGAGGTPELAATIAAIAEAQKQIGSIIPVTTVPILDEVAADRRDTKVQHRGNYLDLGSTVVPGVPGSLNRPPAANPSNRLEFARWLVARQNPLTARVVVNRYWEALFGRGLVATSEDFGAQGELPTHPELLDWLAVELMEHAWDTKTLLKSLVTSATYRQSVQVSPEQIAADRDNRWLARGPRVRLSAEMVRDQALFVAGLLSRKMLGPPVKPPQPNLGLNAAFGGSTDWTTSDGDDRYRRAIYTAWRRSNPYPSLATFDAPNREVCTIRRNQTNTPLQSLVTLNDPAFVEAAQALAREIVRDHGPTLAGIQSGFERCLLRLPHETELNALNSLFQDSRLRLAANPDAALNLATVPLGPLPDGMQAVDLAAMTVVGNVLLNLDELFLKP